MRVRHSKHSLVVATTVAAAAAAVVVVVVVGGVVVVAAAAAAVVVVVVVVAAVVVEERILSYLQPEVEITVLSIENIKLSNVLPQKSSVGRNTAMHVLSTPKIVFFVLISIFSCV